MARPSAKLCIPIAAAMVSPRCSARLRAASSSRDRVSASRYHNPVPINSPHDIDAQLMDWLKRAYELGAA